MLVVPRRHNVTLPLRPLGFIFVHSGVTENPHRANIRQVDRIEQVLQRRGGGVDMARGIEGRSGGATLAWTAFRKSTGTADGPAS